MKAEIVEVCERFRQVLKIYDGLYLFLHPPCFTKQVYEIEKRNGFDLPPLLRVLLKTNNGQRIDDEGTEKGIFKSVSGLYVY